MVVRVKVEGLRELHAALAELPKATAKNAMRRTLLKIAEPLARDMEAGAPVDAGQLRASVKAGTKLSRRQSQVQRQSRGTIAVSTGGGFRSAKSTLTEAYVGAGPLPHAHMMEFGTFKDRPQPFARPAWDRNKTSMLNDFKSELWTQIKRAAERRAKRLARLAAKGK